jgi:hypothetical protein
LFSAVRAGTSKSNGDIRASALVNAEAQLTMMPPDADRWLATAVKANVERITPVLRTASHDNQVVAVRKVSPYRAGNLPDLSGKMQKNLRRIAIAMRRPRRGFRLPDGCAADTARLADAIARTSDNSIGWLKALLPRRPNRTSSRCVGSPRHHSPDGYFQIASYLASQT